MSKKIFVPLIAILGVIGGSGYFYLFQSKSDQIIYIEEDLDHDFFIRSHDIKSSKQKTLFEFGDVPLHHRLLMKQLLWEYAIELVQGKVHLEIFNKEKDELFALLASPSTAKDAALSANTAWVMNDERDIFAVHLKESQTNDLRIVHRATGRVQDVILLDRLLDPIERTVPYDFWVDAIEGNDIFLTINHWPVSEQASVTTFVQYNFEQDMVKEYFNSDVLAKEKKRFGIRIVLNATYVLTDEENREGFLLEIGSDRFQKFSFDDLRGVVSIWNNRGDVKNEKDYIIIEDQLPDGEEGRMAVINALNEERIFLDATGEVNNIFKKGDGIALMRWVEQKEKDGPSNVNSLTTYVKEYQICSPDSGKRTYSFTIQDTGNILERSFVGMI